MWPSKTEEGDKGIKTVHQHSLASLLSQITKAAVDSFKPKLTVPSCLVELVWTGGEQQQQLRHKVTLKGAKYPAYFSIRYDPPVVGKCNIILIMHAMTIIITTLLS